VDWRAVDLECLTTDVGFVSSAMMAVDCVGTDGGPHKILREMGPNREIWGRFY
jgi:hypothetical protein